MSTACRRSSTYTHYSILLIPLGFIDYLVKFTEDGLLQVTKGGDLEFLNGVAPDGRADCNVEVGDSIGAKWKGSFYEAVILAIDGK